MTDGLAVVNDIANQADVISGTAICKRFSHRVER
jgi:hypothetical protein